MTDLEYLEGVIAQHVGARWRGDPSRNAGRFLPAVGLMMRSRLIGRNWTTYVVLSCREDLR